VIEYGKHAVAIAKIETAADQRRNIADITDLADLERSNEYFAVKFYNIGDNRDGLQAFRDPIKPFVELLHPRVMPIVGVIEPTKTRGPIIITRYSESGSLSDVFDRVRNNDPPSFWTSEGQLGMIVGLISGFLYLHSQGTFHREVKPSDLIIESDGSIRICDYVTSMFAEHHYSRASQVGSPSYMAPEVYEDRSVGDKVRDPKTDVFSFSLILYEILLDRKYFRRRCLQRLLCEGRCLTGRGIVRRFWALFIKFFAKQSNAF
jgi:serine/threonine protein kinase